MKILIIGTLVVSIFTSRYEFIFSRSEPMSAELCEKAASSFNESRRIDKADFAYCEDAP